jgi:nucleotidyltransferase/DNA polymerase involved in DNA repair
MFPRHMFTYLCIYVFWQSWLYLSKALEGQTVGDRLVACFLLPQIGVLCECTRTRALVGEPVALALGDTVAVVSDEAARCSIRPGVTVAGAVSLCPALHVLQYDAAFYEEAVRPIWNAVAVETSTVEPASAEVCFGELDGRDILERAEHLVREIAGSIATPVQAGLARTKLLAEQAAHRASPTTVLTVPTEEEAAFLAPLRLSALRQIDSATRDRLGKLGVETLGQLQAISEAGLRRQFKDKGTWLRRVASGEDGETIKALWPPPLITQEYHFDAFGDMENYVNEQTLQHALSSCSKGITAELGAQRMRCGLVTLDLVLSDGTTQSREETLVAAIQDAATIALVASRLLSRLRPASPPISLILTAGQIGVGSAVQLDLLSQSGLDHARCSQLDHTLAALRKHFGIGAVAEGISEPPRRAMLFTHPLTHQRLEPVEVETDASGLPLQVVRSTRRGFRDLSIGRIVDIWKEAKWFCGETRQASVYRFEDEEGGFYDLVHLGFDEWQLTAVAD